MSKTRKAILVVSFGTSFPDTCKKTIDVIEQRIGEHFSDYKIYRAWTSKMIMAKLLERDNIRINNVTEGHGTDDHRRHHRSDRTAYPCDQWY